jgi:hypothetical protein
MKSGSKTPRIPLEGRKFILDIIAVLISATAIFITVVMNWYQGQNNRNQFATVEARLGKLDRPNITAKIKVAFSPNYSQALDEQYLDHVGMEIKNVGYDFYNQSLEEYLNPAQPEQKRYLFVQFMNDGPGIAKRIRIDKIVWEPKDGAAAPAGLQRQRGCRMSPASILGSSMPIRCSPFWSMCPPVSVRPIHYKTQMPGKSVWNSHTPVT